MSQPANSFEVQFEVFWPHYCFYDLIRPFDVEVHLWMWDRGIACYFWTRWELEYNPEVDSYRRVQQFARARRANAISRTVRNSSWKRTGADGGPGRQRE